MSDQLPMPDPRRRFARPIVLLPNGFTLLNLFMGIYAIVAASRGQYETAGTYIVLGGVADAIDGRVARATRSGTRFGAELDSLVDAISFGLAPSMLMFFAVFNQHGWEWVFCFFFTMCAVLRLARFNVEQAGRAKTHFNGLPSPMAGLTLATYYWFRESTVYQSPFLVDLPWPIMLRFIMVGLAFLMISQVRYAAVPLIGYKTLREILGTLIVIGTLVGVIFLPKQFFFPALMAYVIWGVARTFFVGLLGRIPKMDNGNEGVVADSDGVEGVGFRRRRRRRRRGGRNMPDANIHEEPRT